MVISQLWNSFIHLNLMLLNFSIALLIVCAVPVVIYFSGRWLFNLILRNWKNRYPEPAQQLTKWAEILSGIIFIEFVAILGFFINVFNDHLPSIESIFNFTYILNLKNFVFLPNGVSYNSNISSGLNASLSVTNNSNLSFENLSGIISIITIFIIYLYFYSVFSNTKYFAEGSEIQEKYAAIFWAPIYTILLASFLVIFIDLIIHSTTILPDFILLIFGLFNFFIVVPIPHLLRKNFYNNGVDFNTKQPLDFIYNYDFIQKFRKLYSLADIESNIRHISDLILASTIAIVFLAYIYYCNILILIIVEYCFLSVHFWSSQLNLIPSRRITIVLKECDVFRRHLEIKNVFILSDSSIDYFVVLDEHNTLTEIMKDSIYQLVYQND